MCCGMATAKANNRWVKNDSYIDKMQTVLKISNVKTNARPILEKRHRKLSYQPYLPPLPPNQRTVKGWEGRRAT